MDQPSRMLAGILLISHSVFYLAQPPDNKNCTAVDCNAVDAMNPTALPGSETLSSRTRILQDALLPIYFVRDSHLEKARM